MVSAIHQCKSDIGIHMSSPPDLPFTSLCLGCHRTLGLHSLIIYKHPQARIIYLCCSSASPLNQATQAEFKHIRRASGYEACSIYFSLNTKTILFTVHYLERDNMDTDTL